MAGLPERPYYDQYPYERLTNRETARIARMQDKQMRDLRDENALLKAELYHVNQWRKKVIPILDANGIDVDAQANVMAATKEVFGE